MTDPTTHKQALILFSSADQLPLAKPAGESINIGWFLVELAALMAKFEDTHDFVLATPNGQVPTLDINGMALFMHGGADLTGAWPAPPCSRGPRSSA